MGLTLHVDQSTADKLGRRTERVPVEKYKDEYLVGLDVFHQLHCLVIETRSLPLEFQDSVSSFTYYLMKNVLRKGFYPKRYNTSLTKPDGKVDYGKWIHIGKSRQIGDYSATLPASLG